ncbi:MAG: right-handed parallel beta-helix repeat-containing protein, partial [Planctomycetota bacterium]|nr:right-handed parallel beta-helix repeat-containing protein [Planctomycetota bacterium]
MNKLIFTLICLSAFGGAIPCQARIITVDDDGPADFNNIQSAIDDTNDGDTIIVKKGIYLENINFRGKNIILTSTNPNDPCVVATTIIDGQQNGSVVTFNGGEDPNCVLSGVTITNGGQCGSLECAGVACYHSSPTIIRNIITWNWGGEWGGGIYCGESSSPLIIDNTIMKNYSEFAGGIDCWDNSSPLIIGNKILGNFPDCGMGAILVTCSSPTILNNLIALNFGAGIGISRSGKQMIILNNTIVGTLPSGYEHAGIRVYE